MINRTDLDKLNRLRKRQSFLTERVSTSPKHLSYDEAEASALAWAIQIIEKYFSERTEDERH